jgi:hypothetical protein
MDQPSQQVQQPIPEVKKSPQEMISLGIDELKKSLSKKLAFLKKAQPPQTILTPQVSQEVGRTTTPAPSDPAVSRVPPTIALSGKSMPRLPIRLIVTIAVIIVATLILLVIAKMFLGRRALAPSPTPSSTTELSVTPTPAPLTKYATDEAVLKIEQNVMDLDKELSGTDLDEQNLKPRYVNWNIDFKQ